MALKVFEDSIENIWLADHERCDVVVCVIEKSNVGPASKKRILVVSGCGNYVHLGKKCIRLHTRSEDLVRSPYFETCLKESWCKQKGEQRSLVELSLETLIASSQAYQRCIEILCSSEACSASMFSKPLEALGIYLASDHLLFEECSAACMEYLAAAPWSNEEMKVISETFSTSGIKPSEDMAARLGLPKEQACKNLSKTLWYLYKEAYTVDEMDELHPGGSDRLNRFQGLISHLLKGLEMEDSNKMRKKTVLEFLHKATDDCVQELRDIDLSEEDDWVYNNHFQGWLYMNELIMEISDGKKVVEAMALNEDLHKMFFQTFYNILAERNRYELLHNAGISYHNAYVRSIYTIDLPHLMHMVVKVVMLMAEGFRRVAETEIILPELTRNSLIMKWVPWLEKYHTNEKICESVDMPALKVHISKILQTLSMNDEDVLITLAEGAMNEDYFLEGAFKAWFDRLD